MKAQSVPLPGGAGDQHGIQAVFRQFFGNFCNMIHDNDTFLHRSVCLPLGDQQTFITEVGEKLSVGHTGAVR